MKKILLTAGLLTICTYGSFAQKQINKIAKISFNATAPNSPEKIEAVTNEAANVLDIKSGDIAFQVLIKSFKFERALMQEHFNENYMESDKYPKASFVGKITNMPEVNFDKDGTYNAKVTGKLIMHGVENAVTVPGTITIKGSSIMLRAKFSVKLQDYKISIPSVVADKVGKEAVITLESDITKK